MKVRIMFILMILFFLTIETNAQSIPKVTAPEYGWPVSELPIGFPVLDTGQINEVMTKTNNGVKTITIIFSRAVEKDFKDYEGRFTGQGYTPAMFTTRDGFLKVMHQGGITVSIGYTRSSEQGTVSVNIEE